MEDFADEIMRETASRANRGKTPLSYRQMRERWRDTTDKKRVPAPGAVKAAPGGGQSNGGQKGPLNKPVPGKLNRAGVQMKGTAAKFGGNAVCYLFNSRKAGCPRTAAAGGCDNGRGGIYAHVCNYEISTGLHCLAAHPRHANH